MKAALDGQVRGAFVNGDLVALADGGQGAVVLVGAGDLRFETLPCATEAQSYFDFNGAHVFADMRMVVRPPAEVFASAAVHAVFQGFDYVELAALGVVASDMVGVLTVWAGSDPADWADRDARTDGDRVGIGVGEHGFDGQADGIASFFARLEVIGILIVHI